MPVNSGRIFYGWHVAAVAFLANFMTVGTHFYIFNVFMQPLCDAGGWTRTEVNLALVIGVICGMIGQIFFGALVMRIGPRLLMTAGAVAAGAAFIFIGRVQSIWQLYLCYGLLYIGNMAYGGIVANTVVSNWFVSRRGRALGFATSGMSLSGAILPPVAMFILLRTSLPTTSLLIGLAVILVGPVAWLVVRDWPEDYGMAPDGLVWINDFENVLRQARQDAPRNTRSNSWPLTRLLHTPDFYRIGLAYGLGLCGTVGVMSQLKPRFADLGFSDMTAMTMMASTAFIGAVGKFTWGALCDRYEVRKVVALLIVINAGGLGLALIESSVPALILFMAVFGFSMGGIMSTYPVVVAAVFGRESFAAVQRYTSVLLMFQMFGYIIAGQSYDRFASYSPGYLVYIVLDIVAAGLIWSVGKAGTADELKEPTFVSG